MSPLFRRDMASELETQTSAHSKKGHEGACENATDTALVRLRASWKQKCRRPATLWSAATRRRFSDATCRVERRAGHVRGQAGVHLRRRGSFAHTPSNQEREQCRNAPAAAAKDSDRRYFSGLFGLTGRSAGSAGSVIVTIATRGHGARVVPLRFRPRAFCGNPPSAQTRAWRPRMGHPPAPRHCHWSWIPPPSQ